MIALRWWSLHCDNVLTRRLGMAISRHLEALRCLNLQTILRYKKGWAIQSEGNPRLIYSTDFLLKLFQEEEQFSITLSTSSLIRSVF